MASVRSETMMGINKHGILKILNKAIEENTRGAVRVFPISTYATNVSIEAKAGRN